MQHRSILMEPTTRETPEVPINVCSTARQFRDKPGVLVVDDDHLVRIMMQLGLERNGFKVWLASNGHDAIDLYRDHKEDIAVVLLDVHLPGLDGPQILQTLRGINQEIRACFMTGNAIPYTREDLLRCGAVHVVGKPFLLNDLANTLRTLTQGVPA